MDIPQRKLGRTGVMVTILGLGGEGILRTVGYDKEAYALINRALDLGINYCESARAYADSESYYGSALKERRQDIFLTSKSHARSRKGALLHLEETLKNMHSDFLDLWQIHDVRTEEEIEEIFGPGGAAEAFVEAREKGVVRFIGITGHHNPTIIKRCIESFDFDTVLVPINPAEPHQNSFIAEIIPLANRKKMGIIGMKIYLRGMASRLKKYVSMESFYRYALSQPISTGVIGCDSIEQLEQNVLFAESFEPLDETEKKELEDIVAPYARQLMYYKP
jgi:predicted aldo/keto reductase-like oxidoreductase